MGAAKKTKKKAGSKKNPALKTHRTVLKVKLRLDDQEKWRGEINGCIVAFKGHNQNEFWCWSAITPFEWGACVGGIRFDSLQDAIRNAKKRCVAPPPEGKKRGKPSKKKSLGTLSSNAVDLAKLLGAENPPD